MKSPNQPLPPNSNMQFQLNLETLEVLMELNALLQWFGLPLVQSQAAIAMWEDNILTKEDPDTGHPLHYLPVSMLPNFIDQILDQLSAESKAQAILFRDRSHALSAVIPIAAMLKLSKKPEDGGIDPGYVPHNVVPLKPSQGIASANTTQGAL
ncbi:hypothetical protein [Stutzerimonas kunmingensis]|uniref:hypothetical protein n=1 Tax=Stutzerimonas kunmingensis TaxID=1211807 RepID=UPI001F1E5C95|nr:hypothetical protein [Stutzerimonas kunmingensis]UIP32219.1 hypothetical protein LW136_19190 [Stutzerimonas kunmingensis]